jgi:hypothetical protein
MLEVDKVSDREEWNEWRDEDFRRQDRDGAIRAGR